MIEKDIVKRYDSVIGELQLWKELKDSSINISTEKTASSQIILNYYRTNGLFKKIVDLVATDSLRKGITINGDSDKQFENFLNQKSFKKHFINAHKQSRIFGRSLMLLEIDDGQYKRHGNGNVIDNSKPVNYDNIKDIKISYVFPSNQFFVTPVEGDGYPLSWQFYSITPLGSEKQDTIKVHKSRALLFTNEPLFTDAYNLFNNTNYDSIFYSVFEDITRLYDALEMIAKLIEISQIDIVKFDLDERLKSGKNSLEELKKSIKAKLESMNSTKGLYNTIGLDKLDSLERIQSTLTNYDSIVDRFSKQVTAVAGIPFPILFGEKSTGMANSGDKDLENYYNHINAKQESVLLEPIQKFLNLVAKYLKLDEPAFSFNSLWQLSESEIIKNRNIQAQTDKIYEEMGALSSEEIRNSRFAGFGYSSETMINDNDEFEDKTYSNMDSQDINLPKKESKSWLSSIKSKFVK